MSVHIAPRPLAAAAPRRPAGRADLGFLAWGNLVHDRVRFLVTLGGIAVAILLILLQGGMYLGFMQNASGMIDRTGADVWVVSKNSPNFDWSRPFPERYLSKVRSTPGVAEARTLIFAWAFMRLPDGGTEQVEIIGYHPSTDAGWGEPSNFLSGDAMSVVGGDAIVIDESAVKKLKGLGPGKRAEIMEHDVRVAGLTGRIRSMTTAPYVFTSYRTAKKLAGYVGDDNTVFILARAAPGVSAAELKRRIQERLPYVDVLTRREYSARTRRYWTIQTGMGFGFLMMTVLSFGVGLAIVGQTIYAATMEKLREYATLKALGARACEIRAILWTQAGVNAVLGFLIALPVFWWSARLLDDLGLTVVAPRPLYASVLALDVAMCLAASLLSVRKVLELDPAVVFSGGS